MSSVIIIVYFCLIIPTCLMLGFLESKSRMVFGFMIIGINVAFVAAAVNSILLSAFHNDYDYVTANITPVVEELLKALPVWFFTKHICKKQEYIVSVAFAVGVGFALLENITAMLMAGSSLTLLWIVLRGLGAGLMHGICTASVGWGLSLVFYRKRLSFTGTFALLSTAMIFHGTYNMLVGVDALKYYGIALPVTAYVILLHTYRRKKKT